jgi:glycosyltransferase involved in cell wall biosynthesis
VIANGVDPPDAALPDRRAARRALGLPEEEAVVLTLGRLCRQKGQDVLIDAAGLAARQADAAFRLLIVGEGPIRRTLEARVRTRGLNGLVSLPGATAHPELYYAACDLVAMPSRFEGMPYVLLEARAAGRPVAASLCSGMEEFIEHGRDGFLLPVGDREAWAGVLLRASRSRGEMREMGERAGSRLRPEWGAPKSVARLVDVYEGLLKARKGGAQSQGCQPGSD